MSYYNPGEYILQYVSPLVLAILVIWTFVWTGLGLWKAARNSDKWWFVAIFLLNTVGILEILYIYVFSKKKKK